MRTFPHVWVPPGGHVDSGEGLIEAGLRELYEETAISIQPDERTYILGLWEVNSTKIYPIMLKYGPVLTFIF